MRGSMPLRAQLGRLPVVLTAICLLGVLASIGGFLRWDPSLDEAYVYALSQHGFIAMIEFWSQDPQALLSQVVAYPFAVTAHPVWWLRVPAMIAFAGALLAMWWAASARFPRPVALGAAALLAISPLATTYAADARWPMYSMLLGLLSWGALLRAIDGDDRRWWIGYALLLVAGVYTNVILALVIAAQALPVLWGGRRAIVRWAACLGALAVAAIPLVILTAGAGDVNPLFRVRHPAITDIPGFVAEILGGGAPVRARQILVLVIVAVVVAAGVRLRSDLRGPEARLGWLALSWAAVPILTAWVLSQGTNSIWLPRYVIGALPGVCILLAWALWRLPRPAMAAALAAIIPLMLLGVARQATGDAEPTGTWTRAILAARPAGAPVVFYEAEGAQAAGYFARSLASSDGGPIVPGWDETPPPPEITLLDSPNFDRLEKGPPSAALVERLAASTPSGVVVLALRPADPEAPGIVWARAHCTVQRTNFTDSPTAVFRVSECVPGG